MSHVPKNSVTLGYINKQIAAGKIAYLYASCGWQACARRHVPLDQSALMQRLGPDFPIKSISLKCLQCVREGRDPHQVGIFPHWLTTKHVTGKVGGADTLAPRAEFTIIAKRRRRKSSFTWQPPK